MTTNMTGSRNSVVDSLRLSIEEKIPNAVAKVSGAGGHFSIEVVSPKFEGMSRLDSQRLVYSAITHLMLGDQAPVHAVDSLKTLTPT